MAPQTRQRQAADNANTTDPADTAATNEPPKGLSTVGKLAVFFGFPVTMGMLGLYLSYLETLRRPEKELSLDQDFVMPFLLALAMVVVIGIQTAGYTTSKVQPLVAWPKVKRVKRVKHVYKNEKDKDE